VSYCSKSRRCRHIIYAVHLRTSITQTPIQGSRERVILATREWFWSVIHLVMIQYQPMWALRRPKVNSLWRDRLLTLSNKILTVHLTRTRVEPEKHILPSLHLQRKRSDPLNPKRRSFGTSLSILLEYAEVTPSHVKIKNLTRTIAMSSFAMLHCMFLQTSTIFNHW
jgi:hypothetical protein